MINEPRLRFPRGQQKEFITLALARCENIESLARQLNVSSRTIRDWRREKFLMSYKAAQRISAQYDIPFPASLVIEEAFWYTSKSGKMGGNAVYKKYGHVGGDPTARKRKWLEWWEKEGKSKDFAIFHPLPFSKPEKSEMLAEFIGTMMGDGCVTKRQISISLHHINDLAYCHFVVKRMKQLFEVTPSVYHHPKDSVNIIVVSRSDLVKYLHELGLPIGNKVKQKFDIPPWIKESREYMIACIRGLVDTDGSVFTHRYRVNGKMYAYKKICFSSSSPPLITTVHQFLKNEGMHSRISRQGVHVRIESVAGVKRYMDVIGPSNPKHWKRYKSMV